MSQKPSFGNRLILSVFMALLLYGGGTLMAGTVRQLRESMESMSWPIAVGKVTRSEMQAQSLKVRRRGSDGIRRSSSDETYEAQIEYEFEVEGATHKGSRLTTVHGGTLASKQNVEQTLKKYPIGKKVTVSFKPGDPTQCVLEPGNWGGFFALAGLSLILIAIPIVVLWILWGPNQGRCISGL
jgi:Protein of unknown function (DUF3592)